MRGKKKHFVMPKGKGVGERDGYCKSTNKQLLSLTALRKSDRCGKAHHQILVVDKGLCREMDMFSA